jgi:hypothetical protein
MEQRLTFFRLPQVSCFMKRSSLLLIPIGLATLTLILVEKFDRDPKTGKLLWYSGPPIHVTPPLAFAPRHSLTYLTYLAKQQALLEQTGAEDDELEHASKRPRAADGSRPSEPSLRQLLDRWRINPDGGTDYIGDEEPNLEFDAAMASAEQSRDLLARSIRRAS